MAIIEGFRVRNFRPLRDVAMGRLSGGQGKTTDPLYRCDREERIG